MKSHSVRNQPSLLVLASRGGVEPAAKTSWSKNKKLALFVSPSIPPFSLLLLLFLSLHRVVVSFALANRGQLGQSANEGVLWQRLKFWVPASLPVITPHLHPGKLLHTRWKIHMHGLSLASHPRFIITGTKKRTKWRRRKSKYSVSFLSPVDSMSSRWAL